MIWTMRTMLIAILLLALVVLVACGGSDEQAEAVRHASNDGGFGTLEEFRLAATTAPAATAVPAALLAAASGLPPQAFGDEYVKVEDSQVAKERLIVRNVNMRLVVQDISASLDDITALSQELGGRFVSSDHSIKHLGFIAIRVPAGQLDAAVLRLRQMAVEVESEVVDSRDVTDEYVDLTAQLDNLQAAEQAYLKLFDRAEKVEDALEIQRTLTQVQGDVERLQGRIKLLEETAAFSLISVTLELNPAEMDVEAGEDKTTGVHELVRFRASLKPPEGFENYVFTWDFGDGSHPVSSDRTAPTEDPDTRVTATITHVYSDERDSPYFAEIKITGTGEAGVVEGEDTLVVNVTRRPVIEVFAGKGIVAEEGQEVELTGSFTRPEGLSDVEFRWDFGDGTAPATGALEEGATNAVATHAYSDHRPFPYTARLTITAKSDAGGVESSSSVEVQVQESAGWVVAGWSVGDQGKTAVRALSAVGQGVATALIWVGILVPVWAVVGVVGTVVFRTVRRRRRG